MNRYELFEVPLPEKTRSYSPVAHQYIDELVREKITHSRFEIVGQRYQVANGGQQAVGLIDLKANNDTFAYRIGWQNSYDKSRPVAFVAGTMVIICTNGMLLGNTKILRKHTGDVNHEIIDKMDEVMAEVDDLLSRSIYYGNEMQNIKVDKTQTAQLCGRLLLEHDIITSTQLNIIRGNYQIPEEWDTHTLWNLYNNTTHALKTTHPYNYLVNHKRLQEFVEAEFNL